LFPIDSEEDLVVCGGEVVLDKKGEINLKAVGLRAFIFVLSDGH
jgi:hypothetical protein